MFWVPRPNLCSFPGRRVTSTTPAVATWSCPFQTPPAVCRQSLSACVPGRRPPLPRPSSSNPSVTPNPSPLSPPRCAAGGDAEEEIIAHTAQGGLYYAQGDFKRAIECQRQALRLAEDSGNSQAQVQAYSNMGAAYFNLGDYKQTIQSNKLAWKLIPEEDLEVWGGCPPSPPTPPPCPSTGLVQAPLPGETVIFCAFGGVWTRGGGGATQATQENPPPPPTGGGMD